MSNKLDLLLDIVKEVGGSGKVFNKNGRSEKAIFFLNLQRIYVASLIEQGVIVRVIVNSPNKIGGAVDIFGHYCFPEADKNALIRLDEFYSKLNMSIFFDLQEELRTNNDIDLIIQNIACELGYAI